MKHVQPFALLSPPELYDEYLALLEDMKGWPDADVRQIEEQILHTQRKRALAVRLSASQDGGVRLQVTGDVAALEDSGSSVDAGA